MSDVLLELETILFWNRAKDETGYCVFSEYVDEDEKTDNGAAEREAHQEEYRAKTTDTLENITKMVRQVLKEVKNE